LNFHIFLAELELVLLGFSIKLHC